MDFSKRKYLMADVSVSTKLSSFRKGDMIFKKGDESTVMYHVLEGEVGLYLHYGDKKRQVLLDTRAAGDFFGEIALLEKRPRTATAVALCDDTRLEETSSAEGFITYVRKYPRNLGKILDTMSFRFKEQRSNYLQACVDLAEYKELIEQGKAPSAELAERISDYLADAERVRNKKGEG